MSRRRRNDSSGNEDEAPAFNKRRRMSETSEEIEKRLESLICRVGEKSTSSLESNLEGLAGVLEADLQNFKPQILRILVLCSYFLPEKCTIYSTLIGLLNVRNYNCGAEYVEMMVRELKRLINNNEYEHASNLVVFLADLTNCQVVSHNSLIELFQSFLTVSREDEVPQARRDWYVYTVLSALPIVGSGLKHKHPAELDNILATIHAYVTSRRKRVYTQILRVWSTDDPHSQEEYLDCLLAQVEKLSNDNWVEEFIPRPYRAFEGVLCDSLQHNLPTFIPPPHKDGSSKYPLPRIVFRMFDYTDCPEGPLIPGNHAIERFLIEEYVRNTMYTQRMQRKECAGRILSVPGANKVPISHIVVEVMFGEMFRLPASRFPDVFYTAIFIELCKMQPTIMPQVLALASELLFERLDTMNTICIDRFVNWFSQHLSNFQFRWSWEEWGESLKEGSGNPKPKFAKEVLEKCLRLSYHARIFNSVPEDFSSIVPVEPVIIYKYSGKMDDSSEVDDKLLTASQQLTASIRQKADKSEIEMILETIPNSDPNASYNRNKLDVLLQTVLNIAQKSFSHSFSGLGKFHTLIKSIAVNEDGKIDVLRILHDTWCNHPQMITVLIEKMLRMQIVDCIAVAKWIFSPDMAQDFTRMYVWEILHITLRKMQGHVEKMEMDLQDAQDKSQVAVTTEEEEEENEDGLKGFNLFAPNEEEMSKYKENVASAKTDQKNLYLVILQRFLLVLSDHLVQCEKGNKNPYTPWYKCTRDRLQEIFLVQRDNVRDYIPTIGKLLFTDDLHPNILSIYQQYCSLYA